MRPLYRCFLQKTAVKKKRGSFNNFMPFTKPPTPRLCILKIHTAHATSVGIYGYLIVLFILTGATAREGVD